MAFKFLISPIIYALMLTLEMYGVYLITKLFTRVGADKRRLLIGTAVVVGLIFILDVFVFDYHKTLTRSFIILFLIIFYLKYINQLSLFKVILQTIIIFVVMAVIDACVQLIAGNLFLESLDWLYSYFSYMYAIYLAILYMLIALLSILNIKFFDFNKKKDIQD